MNEKKAMAKQGARTDAADGQSTTEAEQQGENGQVSSALMKRTAYVMDKAEVARFNEIAKLLGVSDVAELEVISGGKVPFWPAEPGTTCVGIVEGRREVPTRYKTPSNPTGSVGLYTLKLLAACNGATKQSLQDGEILDMQPGDRISVLERSVLKELKLRVGQKIAILCVGKAQGSEFKYWDYRIVGVPRSAAEMQAAAQLVMAKEQEKALSPHTP